MFSHLVSESSHLLPIWGPFLSEILHLKLSPWHLPRGALLSLQEQLRQNITKSDAINFLLSWHFTQGCLELNVTVAHLPEFSANKSEHPYNKFSKKRKAVL